MSNNSTTPPPSRIDVLQMLRDAQGDAHEASIAQAHLKGMLDGVEAMMINQNPTVTRLKAMLHTIRDVADEAAQLGGDLPAPYGYLLKQVSHWIDVADDAFKAIQ